MNARLFLSGLLLALGLGAAGLWLECSTCSAVVESSEQTARRSGVNAAEVESAREDPAAKRTLPAAQPAEATAATSPVEVVPLLELPGLLEVAFAQSSSEQLSASLDALLGARYDARTRQERETCLRSIREVLAWQAQPEALKSDQRMSAQAIQALEIEAGWLKEHLDP
jgi:hypothetical protein